MTIGNLSQAVVLPWNVRVWPGPRISKSQLD